MNGLNNNTVEPDENIVECVYNSISNNDKIPDISNIERLNNSTWIVDYNDDRYYVRRNGFTYESDARRSVELYVKAYYKSLNISFIDNYNKLQDSHGDMFVSVKGVCVADKQDNYGRTINYIVLNDGFGVSCIVKDDNISLENGCKYELYGVRVSPDYGWTLHADEKTVTRKIDTGYRTDYVSVAEERKINGESKTVVDSGICTDFDIRILRKTIGVEDGYIILDKTSFFKNDFVTRGELINDLFENTPDYYKILTDENYLRKIFKEQVDYKTSVNLTAYDKYDYITVYGRVEDVEWYNDDNKPTCEFVVNNIDVTVWKNVTVSEGEYVVIVLGQVGEYNDDYCLNVGDQSVILTTEDL